MNTRSGVTSVRLTPNATMTAIAALPVTMTVRMLWALTSSSKVMAPASTA